MAMTEFLFDAPDLIPTKTGAHARKSQLLHEICVPVVDVDDLKIQYHHHHHHYHYDPHHHLHHHHHHHHHHNHYDCHHGASPGHIRWWQDSHRLFFARQNKPHQARAGSCLDQDVQDLQHRDRQDL